MEKHQIQAHYELNATNEEPFGDRSECIRNSAT